MKKINTICFQSYDGETYLNKQAAQRHNKMLLNDYKRYITKIKVCNHYLKYGNKPFTTYELNIKANTLLDVCDSFVKVLDWDETPKKYYVHNFEPRVTRHSLTTKAHVFNDNYLRLDIGDYLRDYELSEQQKDNCKILWDKYIQYELSKAIKGKIYYETFIPEEIYKLVQ